MNELNQNQTDNFFRQALNSPPPIYPTDKEWKAMKRRIKPEDERRAIIAWKYWAAGIAAALLIFFSIWFLPQYIMTENQQAKNDQNKEQPGQQAGKDNVEKTKSELIKTKKDETQNAGAEISKDHYAASPSKPFIASDTFISQKIDVTVIERNELNIVSREPYVPLSSASDLGLIRNNHPGIDNIQAKDPVISMSTSGFVANIANDTSSSDESPALQDPAGKWALSMAVAPDLNSVKGLANSNMGLGLGIGLSYKLSKSISASTGLFYAKKTYNSDKSSYKVKEKPFATWTSYSKRIEADCRVLDIPLNLNMVVKSGSQGKLLASAGLSSYIMLSEKYNFIYNSTPAYPAKSREYTITNKNQHILSVVNLAVGVEKPLTKQVSLVIQPYAKIPLTGIGQGQTNLKSFGVGFQLNYSLKKKHDLFKQNR